MNPALNEGLPPFLAAGAGLNSGFMMPQVTAAALVSENKILAHPASVDSITTSGNKEDFVSDGNDCGSEIETDCRKHPQCDGDREAMAAAAGHVWTSYGAAQARQAWTWRPMRRDSVGVLRLWTKDRVMYQDFARIAELIASGKVAEALK